MKCEILAPAGDEQSAYVALDAGADAVYLGLNRFSARASAQNFDLAALGRVTRYAHLLGAKVYVALNILVKDAETEDFFASAVAAWNAGADALLMQDIFLGAALKKQYPEIVLHLSTQGGCCHVYGAEIAKRYGFSRVVLARETPIEDVTAIAKCIETEVFVQGALCSSFSGQCYFSSFAGNNSGNRGRCKQPCRMKYKIDGMGCENPAYALSLSDLCMGKRTAEWIAAGVCSLKIEGRMRRPEYIAAAVRYYRAVLAGREGAEEFSDLKRAYNRGDYTEGLGFGQKKDLLSRDVQGHIGERVGEISLVGGRAFCKSEYVGRRGDGFKILRGGKEVGGASYLFPARGGFLLTSEKKLLAGDEVRLTTDVGARERLLSGAEKRSVCVVLRIVAGEKPRAACGDFVFEGEDPVPEARRTPLTAENIRACFAKTDGLPLAPEISVETEGAFLTFGALNAFRRAFYAALTEALLPRRPLLAPCAPPCTVEPVRKRMVAVIAQTEREGGEKADIVIVKPRDYAKIAPPSRAGVYLYLPPLFTSRDEAEINSVLPFFEGIYCEGTYGIALAEKYRISLFAGTGFNLTNRYAVAGVKEAGAKYFALSKEISNEEQKKLRADGAFCLAYGDIKLMDLCYCPFGKRCAACEGRFRYTMTDEAGRKFPLRRYRIGGACRFEVYNCAPLAADGGGPVIADCSLGDGAWLARTLSGDSAAPGATRGHFDRSVL